MLLRPSLYFVLALGLSVLLIVSVVVYDGSCSGDNSCNTIVIPPAPKGAWAKNTTAHLTGEAMAELHAQERRWSEERRRSR